MLGGDGIEVPSTPPRRILVVEDEDLWWRAVERALRACNWDCERACSVAEVETLLRGGFDFDAVLVDLNLGDGGRGEDVLKLLAARPALIATVVSSAYGNSANTLGLHGVPHVDKSEPFDTLRAALDEEVELTRMVTSRGLPGAVARSEKGLLREILDSLRATGGNQLQAALRLGMPRTTLRDKMELYGLRSAAFKRPDLTRHKPPHK